MNEINLVYQSRDPQALWNANEAPRVVNVVYGDSDWPSYSVLMLAA